MKYIQYVILMLLIISCNDDSPEYPKLSAEPGAEQLDIENEYYTTTLLADPLLEGQEGVWVKISGRNGYFEDSTFCTTAFSGEPGQTYSLEWRVSNEIEEKSARTTVSFKAMKPEVQMVLTDTIENMYLNLYGNLPRYGASAKWEILAGDSWQINNADSLDATLWGLPNTKYHVQYSHIYGEAIESTDFIVTLGEFSANAGIDKTVVPSTSTDTAQRIITLWGDLPYGATGTWRLIGGEGGEVILPDDPHSLFKGKPEEAYFLEWTVNYNNIVKLDTVQFSIMGQWGRFIDPADDEEYKTIIIADLEWMAENFRRTYIYDGEEEGNWWYGLGANSEMVDREIDSTKVPGNAVDTEEERRYYGKLYPMHYAQALAPEGWRLPTSEEFIAMTKEFGGLAFSGVKLYDGGSSGLNLVAGGYYAPPVTFGYGQFVAQTEYGAYWSYTDLSLDPDFAYYYLSYAPAFDEAGNEILNSNESIGESITNVVYALSVRYVRDIR